MLQELIELQHKIAVSEFGEKYQEADNLKMYLVENYLPVIIETLQDYEESHKTMVKHTRDCEMIANGYKSARNHLENLAKAYDSGDIYPNKKNVTMNLVKIVRMMDRVESGEERVSVG